MEQILYIVQYDDNILVMLVSFVYTFSLNLKLEHFMGLGQDCWNEVGRAFWARFWVHIIVYCVKNTFGSNLWSIRNEKNLWLIIFILYIFVLLLLLFYLYIWVYGQVYMGKGQVSICNEQKKILILYLNYTECLKKNGILWKNGHNYLQTHPKCKKWGCFGKFRIFATL